MSDKTDILAPAWGQNEGQILKIREILYIISFYQLSTPPSGIP